MYVANRAYVLVTVTIIIYTFLFHCNESRKMVVVVLSYCKAVMLWLMTIQLLIILGNDNGYKFVKYNCPSVL